jgi:hypothetical protein
MQEEVAQALKAYGNDFLLGDVDSFNELVRQRGRESELYALERELRRRGGLRKPRGTRATMLA